MEIKGILKKHAWKIVLGTVVLLAAVLGGIYYVTTYVTYGQIEITKNYANDGASEGEYEQYLDGVLKYSRDGIALLSESGEEIWNQPCQMSHPIVEICKDTAAVADKGGTSICVFQKSGLKGEIHTTMPIEKISVSSQGIVAAILKNDESPKVMCYDADGNVLVELGVSKKGLDYPIDIALSHDGNVLSVSYLGTKGSSVLSEVVYYHFGAAGEDKSDYQVAKLEYLDTIVPVVSFLEKKLSILISNNSISLIEGLEEPTEVASIMLDKEIKRVAYNEDHIALVLKNSGQTDYELRLYSTDGKQEFSTQFEGEYTNVEIVDNQIIMFDGSKCTIYNQAGTCKYEGELEMSIKKLFPVSGFNKYMVISTNGFQEIQLVK